MNSRLLLGLTAASMLFVGQGALAAMGKILSESFREVESRHGALEKLVSQRVNFDALKTKEGSEAHELAVSIAEVARFHEKGNANEVKEFALRGAREAKIVKSLAKAKQILDSKEKEVGLAEADKTEVGELKAAVRASAGFISAIGKNPVLGKPGEKSTEALDKLVSVLPKIISEYSKDERRGYVKLLDEMTEELNRVDNIELPAEILRNKLGLKRLNHLLGCKS